jgi:hypothetical protein
VTVKTRNVTIDKDLVDEINRFRANAMMRDLKSRSFRKASQELAQKLRRMNL